MGWWTKKDSKAIYQIGENSQEVKDAKRWDELLTSKSTSRTKSPSRSSSKYDASKKSTSNVSKSKLQVDNSNQDLVISNNSKDQIDEVNDEIEADKASNSNQSSNDDSIDSDKASEFKFDHVQAICLII